MITKLTPEQEAMMPVWSNKWIAEGIKTTPFTLQEKKLCTDAVVYWYKKAGFKEPKVIYVSSPIVAVLAANVIKNMGKDIKNKAVNSAVYSAVDSAVRSAVRSAKLENFESWCAKYNAAYWVWITFY